MRAVNTILNIVLTFSVSTAFAVGPVPPPVQPIPTTVVSQVQEVDWIKVGELRKKQMQSYKQTTGTVNLLDDDIASFLTEAERLKLYPDVPGFRAWLKENQTQVAQTSKSTEMKDASVSEFATIMYLTYTTTVAAKMDRAAPAKAGPVTKSANQAAAAAKSKKTKGEQLVSDTIHWVAENPFVWVTAGGAWGANMLRQLLVVGPGARMTNTAFEPVMGPVLERMDKGINSTIGVHPLAIKWRRFVSGDSRRAKEAVRQSETGKDLVGEAVRFSHPAISVKEFTAAHEAFYTEFTKADLRWKGWETADSVRSRNTGFELLFHQYTSFGERQNTYGMAIKFAENELERHSENLIKRGLTETEITEFQKLVRDYQEVLVFETPQHPALAELDGKIQATIKAWLDKGVPPKLINKAYGAQLDSIVTSNRKAFSLASFLYAELFYRENNLAMRDLPKVQAYQEDNRNFSGLYRELEEEREGIEKIFKKMGIKYDVQARIDERGFALGGTGRPKGMAPIRDPVAEALKGCPTDFAKIAP